MFDKQLKEDLLVAAFEGGSNYWYMIDDIPENHRDLPYSLRIVRGVFARKSIPVYDVETGDQLGVLNSKALKKAEDLMKTQYPNQYCECLTEQWDADTADIYLQLAVMGEVVFG